MTEHLACHVFADNLADLLEREVAEPTRAKMESHALECAECGPLLADLRKLRIDASSLPELTPSRDLWEGIAARIDAPVIPIGTRDGTLGASDTFRGWRGREQWGRWARMATAAAVLIAATSATTYYLTVRSSTVTPAVATRLDTPTTLVATRDSASAMETTKDSAARPAAAPRDRQVGRPQSAIRLASTKPTAEQVYDSEITRLRAIVERRRAQLDPVTISIVERNLRVIDDAITQCRGALAKDPASRFLMESLNNALENKVELLRTAAMLPSRT
jgi:hypothetical protein